ncbi:hypothetical protein CAAN1_14S03708 [[Candida] anglica]|uniref:Uncharacterized protein n=1 Tax=[Candida] anglica TaxID=148631 RepID=A0ABP0EII2_9ASCO
MKIPETPSEEGYFGPQQGYADISIKTQSYSDKPTPLAASQGKVGGFISEHTDREHQKKYAKEGGKKLFSILFNALCK